jgi:Bacterial membrane protein YfhO
MRANRNPPACRRAPATTVPRKNRLSRFATLLAGLCLLLVGGLIFREFLFGSAVLLYKDIGSDSLFYHTGFVHLSNYIRSQGFPSWSFYVGMGQDLAYATGNLVWQPVSWLPSSLIAPALVFQHLGKVLIAGLFFFRFLQLRRLHSPAPLLGSLLLSFSAYMCMGSCWYPFADEVVCFAGILLATEEAVQHGRWLILALAVALVGMITPFHLYLCALFLMSYVPIRLFGQYGWQPRIILRTCFALAAVATLGVGLGAIVTLPYFHAVLNSPRGSGTTSAVAALSSFPFFGFESPLHYITATLKPFANDILGTGTDFHGWQNYLEAPLTYCGLLCLLILPQVLMGGTRRHQIIFVLFLVGMLVPTVFPWFRYLFWLFQGNYYRTYSLFCVLGVITLSMMAFSRYIEGRTLRLWLLLATTMVLVGTLYVPFEPLQILINPSLKSVVTILLISYGLLLTAGQLLKRQKLAAWLILGLSAIELVQFDRITVSNRKTVKKEEVRGRVGNKDETIDALRDIMTSDNERFFRIRKLQPSGSSLMFTLNDAMAFGYYGTSSYNSFNNVNYTNFLTAVNAIPPNSETGTRWSVGLLNDPILSLFACEKYALVDNPLAFQRAMQYEFVKRYEKGYLFRNVRFLPFGLTFDRYVTEDAFLKLPADEKPAVLLGAVVLSNKSEGEKQGLTQTNLSDLEQDARNFSLADVVAARRKTALELTSFGQTRFEGNVFLDQRSILVLQTPFDRGWRAFQDGQAVPVLKVDVGLLGVGLDAGEHKVELHYRNPFLLPALAVTLASFLILGAGLWRWPRLGLPA